MGKIAFVFAGQGAQAPGMGKGFYETSEASKAVFDTIDQVRPGTSAQCFEGTEEELQITENTQPCLYAVEMAIAAAVEQAGIHADVTAGFSLGELSAITYAKMVSLTDGFQIVKTRGELMQEAAMSQAPSAMAAIIKLTNEQVEEICSQFDHLYPVNYNCPGQITVSGDAQQMDAFAEAVKTAGGRARILKVNGAYHSPYMDPAAARFSDVLKNYTFEVPTVSVYANYTGQIYGADVLETLTSQINHPVRWETSVRNMIADGVDTFIEIGPGKTLTGLIKRISSDVRLFNVAVPEDLEKLLLELK